MPLNPTNLVVVYNHNCATYTIIDFPSSALDVRQPNTKDNKTDKTVYPQYAFILPPLRQLSDCGQEITLIKVNGLGAVPLITPTYNDPNPPTYSSFTIQSANPMYLMDNLNNQRQAITASNSFPMSSYTTYAKFLSIYIQNINQYAWLQIR